MNWYLFQFYDEPFPQQSALTSSEGTTGAIVALPEEETARDDTAMQPGESTAEGGEKPLEEESHFG